jgi:hypothetical protein
MTYVISNDELPHSQTAYKFEGYRYGDADLSFFLTDAPPGSGPELHAQVRQLRHRTAPADQHPL